MNKLRLTTLAVTIAGVLYVPAALSETHPEQGLFLGAKVGAQMANDTETSSIPSDVTWGVLGGYRFSPSWSWDIGYQETGDMKRHDITVNTSVIESAARYDMWLNPDWSLYGRVGVAYWDVDKQVGARRALEEGFSPMGELGINYAFAPHWMTSLGYQFISGIGDNDTLGAYDAHNVMFGLTYQFGDTGPTEEELARARQAEEAQRQADEAARLAQEQRQTEEAARLAEEQRLAQEAAQQAAALKAANDLDERLTLFGSETIDIQFAINSNAITDQQRTHMNPQLQNMKAIMDEYPQVQAHFVGHTDSSGSEAYNQTISERRAEAVADELVAIGGDRARINTKGMGEIGASPQSNPAERRVEIILTCDSCQ